MILKVSAASLLMLGLSSSPVDASARTVIGKDVKDRYDSGLPWTTLQDGTEFQPASGELSPLAQEHLRRLTSSEYMSEESPYYKLFADGAETYYDDYAQAWRALGWYIDCDYCDDNDGCWWNQGDDEDGGGDNRNSGCRRFLLWAAYVDENYAGNGVGEYKYYDRKSNSWNDQACKYGKSTRCVPMDCHLPNTHFTLLGFFREPNYNEWMEQLFKHEGDCVWTDKEYVFMQGDREAWPQGCVATTFTDQSTGKTIRYALKPEPYGDMGIGLYTDQGCIEEYQGSLTVDQVMHSTVCEGYAEGEGGGDGGDEELTQTMCSTNNTNLLYYYNELYNSTYNGDGHPKDVKNNIWSLEQYLSTWNDAFDVYKQCQPCKTYDLTFHVAGKNYQKNLNGDRYIYNAAFADQGDDYDGDHGDMDDDAYDYTFQCHDAADYNNVNQCMKFKTKTRMMTATFGDVQLAGNQGTITEVQIPGFTGGHSTGKISIGKGLLERGRDHTTGAVSLIVLLVSSVVFGFSLYKYCVAKEDGEAEVRGPLLEMEPQYPEVVIS